MDAFIDEILTAKFLEHLIIWVFIIFCCLMIWVVLDTFNYFLKKRKRAKKNEDGGYLRWL